MAYIPDYTDEDFKKLVSQVMDLTHERKYCTFLKGDFERIKLARKLGDFDPTCLRNKILGVPFSELPLRINDFKRVGIKDDRVAHQVVRWRLQLGK